MGIGADRTDMMQSGSSSLRAIDSDALIEPSFRRLLSSIEAERERIRGTSHQMEQEKQIQVTQLEDAKRATEDWCYNEKQKIDAEWKRLDKLSEQMNDLWPSTIFYPNDAIVEINCSGTIFEIPRGALRSIEGSVLKDMFSDEFMHELPKDENQRFLLDFNPICFGLVIEYLQNRRLRPDCPLPVIPQAQQKSMELLAQAWKLTPFLRQNRVNPVHGTSLLVSINTLESTHPGWQVISSEHPLPMAGPSYFEVKILKNPDPRGGLAIGVCGHMPQGSEIHSIRLIGSCMYNSNNGLIGDVFDPNTSDVAEKLQLVEGNTFGVKHDVAAHCLMWFHNRMYVGKSPFNMESLDQVRAIYPVFALYVTGLVIQVDFQAAVPSSPQDGRAR